MVIAKLAREFASFGRSTAVGSMLWAAPLFRPNESSLHSMLVFHTSVGAATGIPEALAFGFSSSGEGEGALSRRLRIWVASPDGFFETVFAVLAALRVACVLIEVAGLRTAESRTT